MHLFSCPKGFRSSAQKYRHSSIQKMTYLKTLDFLRAKEILQQKLYDAGRELYKLRFLPCPEECLMGWGIHDRLPQISTERESAL